MHGLSAHLMRSNTFQLVIYRVSSRAEPYRPPIAISSVGTRRRGVINSSLCPYREPFNDDDAATQRTVRSAGHMLYMGSFI
jgi:hypothetical protein